MTIRKIILFLFFFVLVTYSCKQDKKSVKKSHTKQETRKKTVKIPVFNGDSAYYYVKKQVDFGPRVTGSEAHKKAQQWFIDKFKSLGAEVEVQKFDAHFANGTSAKAANIIATFNPGKSKKVIIASHYDSRYMAEKDPDESMRNKAIDGADDGASGVGVILELARVISQNPIDMSVQFILFDAEDNGDSDKGDETWCLGSQYWSNQAAKNGERADFGVLLDMVGARGAMFPKEGISKRYAGPVQDIIWNLAANMGYGDLFADVEKGFVNDDHLYVNQVARIAMVDIINIPGPDGKFGDYHHTHKDNMDIIDKNTLRRTGQVLTALLYKYSTNEL